MSQLEMSYAQRLHDAHAFGELHTDFSIQRVGFQRWEIEIRSSRGNSWARAANYLQPEQSDGVIRTDLNGANEFLRTARLKGLRCEYFGPSEVVRF